ncbi:MAG TPA: endonuclease/exonuclease/phosphatase family protein [Candidatus Acidoferrales bacterium]|nr:endonuclease/exonuclease/phosphatase family protein [Candidatus Acidoferrales bacterium]
MKRSGRVVSYIVAALVLPFNVAIAGPSRESFTPHRNAVVMTQNLYLGTDVALLLAPTTLPGLIAAVTFALQQVQFTNFAERAPRIADEIATTGPALVGLQEVAKWSTGATPDAPDVRFDFLALLLDALEAKGAHYVPVVVRTNLDAAAPGLDQNNQLIFVRLVDREVLLARTDLPTSDLKISNLQTQTFSHLFSFFNPLVGQITVPRGWISADVKVRGKTFRFINAQLESFDPDVQLDQANELLAGPASTSMPLVLSGDFNSSADGGPDATQTYPDLLAAGFEDAWAEANPLDAGDTCCQDASLDNDSSELFERIDLVLLRGGIGVAGAELIGTMPDLMAAPPFWPSDHAGLVATLRIPTQAAP